MRRIVEACGTCGSTEGDCVDCRGVRATVLMLPDGGRLARLVEAWRRWRRRGR